MILSDDAYPPVSTIVADLLSVIDQMDAIPRMSDDSLQSIKTRCAGIPGQIQSNRIRIAVVGVIKSGKSTLINAMTGKEVVKRGAGVVTAVTTRIRKGRKNRAILLLKSWDDINHALKHALEMFPGDESDPLEIDLESFDLRRKNDRDFLTRVYDRLVRDFPVTDQGIRPETLVIRNALQGYDTCSALVGADRERLIFEGRQFEDHKLFTGDAANAFYVADACLELFGRTLDPRVELADCQGADSTDPGQLNRIVTYLQQANLIIYCISSRIGLRRSDMRFLKIIQGMGLLENIVFVNNCDLSEHDTLHDLQTIEHKTVQELEFLVPSPQLYSFSALMRLFEAMEKKLSRRNRNRLALWQEDRSMASWCSDNADRFDAHLSGLLERRYYRLLVSNPLSRLFHMSEALENKARLFVDMLDSDRDDRENIQKTVARIQDNARRLESIVENAIPGAVSGLTREIEARLDEAFAEDTIQIRRKITDFVNQTPLDGSACEDRFRETGVKKALYLMFQDFRRDLDLFVITDILPEINSLVSRQENRIESYFQSLLDTYRIDLTRTSPVWNLPEEMDTPSRPAAGQHAVDTGVDVQAVKKILGLTLPGLTLLPRYSGRIQTHVLTGMGVSFITRFFQSLLDRQSAVSFSIGFDAAARKIKKQTLQGVNAQIEQFHARLKHQYFTPLIQAVTRDVIDKIHDRFAMYANLDTDMAGSGVFDETEKRQHREKITGMVTRLQQIRRNIVQLKEADVHQYPV
ncbi:MAG: dynamin family protein [Desulfotignum sp.]